MEITIKEFELQFDNTKPNGVVIRLNDETGCKLRICGIPSDLVYDPNGNLKDYIDISFKNINK